MTVDRSIMAKGISIVSLIGVGFATAGCAAIGGPKAAALQTPDEPDSPPSYASDVSFLQSKTGVIELAQGEGRIAVTPGLQGRVMTSGFTGEGLSLGWVNRGAIEQGEADVPFNNFGGQDRIWLGPEGGQFSLYFAPGAPQNFDTWQVPKEMHTGAFKVVDKDAASVRMKGRMNVTNASGTDIAVELDRSIRLVDRLNAELTLGVPFPAGVHYVGYVSQNIMTNVGDSPLTPESGTVSIWSMGQFPGRRNTIVIAPYNRNTKGKIVESSYFGEPPAERVVIDKSAGVVLFRADARLQSKIGIDANRTRDRIASIDFDNNVLIITQFDLTPGKDQYVNSLWQNPQENPYAGDVINSYNHHGKGGEYFYELESSSPAAFLQPGESIAHNHRTLQFHGSIEDLSKIAAGALGIPLDRVREKMP